jgi:hypothetical protein
MRRYVPTPAVSSRSKSTSQANAELSCAPVPQRSNYGPNFTPAAITLPSDQRGESLRVSGTNEGAELPPSLSRHVPCAGNLRLQNRSGRAT